MFCRENMIFFFRKFSSQNWHQIFSLFVQIFKSYLVAEKEIVCFWSHLVAENKTKFQNFEKNIKRFYGRKTCSRYKKYVDFGREKPNWKTCNNQIPTQRGETSGKFWFLMIDFSSTKKLYIFVKFQIPLCTHSKPNRERGNRIFNNQNRILTIKIALLITKSHF